MKDTIGIYEAKTHLSRLIDESAETGEAVVITRNGRPVAELRALPRVRKSSSEVVALFREFRRKHVRQDVPLLRDGETLRDLIHEGHRV